MKKVYLAFVALFVLLGVPLLSRVHVLTPATAATSEGSASAASAADATLLRARLAAARTLLEARQPETTDRVTLAVEDSASNIHLLEVSKETFLSKGAEASVESSLGASLRLQVVRPNGVNTTVRVADESGTQLRPLLVQYPIEKGGRMTEVAYYASAHPAIRSEALVRGGSRYVRSMLDAAAARLAEEGKTISPEIVDVAERLCVVEHTDHKRFNTEDRAALFDEIYTLYALNAGDTYRHSVSTAGAGGMIQMIPQTYAATRASYSQVGLKEDFVAGMRDHSNALQAMLLYMQDTWDYLDRSEEVRAALADGTATQAELLAAGYNSNPARLAGYLQRGGTNWRALIPAETQMYLRIYASVESLADFAPRS